VAEIRARLRQYLEAGIDTAFVSLQSSATDPAEKRARLRDALRALAPAGH
jgi:hypothetical protein